MRLSRKAKVLVTLGVGLGVVVSCALLIGTVGFAQAKKTIWFITTPPAHPVWLEGRKGFEKACAEMGYTGKFVGSPNANLQFDIGLMEQAIAEKADGILVFPYDVDAFTKVIDKAVDAGIQVVTIHADAPNSKRRAYIGPNPPVYSAKVADEFGRLLGGKGYVAVTSGEYCPTENLCYESFKKRLEEKWPGIKLVTRELEGTELVKAVEKAVSLLNAHPEIQAVYSTTGGGAVAWSKAKEETGRHDLLVVGMDVTKQNLDLVKEGKVYAVVEQGIYEEGYLGAKKILDPNFTGIHYTDNPLITKDVVDKYYTR